MDDFIISTATITVAALSHVTNGILLLTFFYKILRYDLKLKWLKVLSKKWSRLKRSIRNRFVALKRTGSNVLARGSGRLKQRSSTSVSEPPATEDQSAYYGAQIQEDRSQLMADDEDDDDDDDQTHFLNLPTRLQITYTIIIFIHTFHEYTAFVSPDTNSAIPSFGCYVQYFVVQLFTLLTGMYTLAIAVWMYLWIIDGRIIKRKTISRAELVLLELFTHGTCWFVALTLTLLPFYGNTIGPSGGWCWVRRDSLVARYMQMAAHYVPIWFIQLLTTIIFVYTMILVYRMYNAVHKSTSTVASSSSNSVAEKSDEKKNVEESDGNKIAEQDAANNATVAFEQSSTNLVQIGEFVFATETAEPSYALKQYNQEFKIYSKLLLWPAVFLLIRVVPTINRLQAMIFGKYFFVLSLFHSLTTGLHGLLNALVYFINPLEHIVFIKTYLCCSCFFCHLIQRKCCCKKGQKKPKLQIEDDTTEAIMYHKK